MDAEDSFLTPDPPEKFKIKFGPSGKNNSGVPGEKRCRTDQEESESDSILSDNSSYGRATKNPKRKKGENKPNKTVDNIALGQEEEANEEDEILRSIKEIGKLC